MNKRDCFILKQSEATKFIEDSNKNIISVDFLQKCIEASDIFNKDNKKTDCCDKPLSDDIEDIIKNYLKKNLKVDVKKKTWFGVAEATITISLEGEIISQDTLNL